MTVDDKVNLVEGSGKAPAGAGVLIGATKAIPTLCLPALTLSDGPGGVGDLQSGVTQLPAPVALAATWSTKLATQYGGVIGAEQRTKGNDVELGPTINIQRDPRWGRNFEALSEDPNLTGAIAAAEIRAVQARGVIDEVKHFAAYNQETNRLRPSDDAIVSARALQEIYLPAFHAAISQGGAGAVMCSYNEVNGVPACQDPYLLTTVLKQWGFVGYTSSDYLATHSTAASITAGLDQEMPGGIVHYFGAPLRADLANGTVTSAALDSMVAPILATMFRSNLLSDPPTGSPADIATSRPHAAVGLGVAEAGTVLLKNARHLLPLGPLATSIAVIGPDAGSYAATAGKGSAHVLAGSVESPFAGIKARLGSSAIVSYAQGVPPPSCTAREGPASSPSLAQAVSLARRSKIAVVFVNDCESEGSDRRTLVLPGQQNQLIKAVAAANRNTVVVLNTGGPVTMPWLRDVASVVEAWYPGEGDGTAIAAVLAGDVDPSGHLPQTFPVSVSQLPTASPASFPGRGGTVNYSEGIFVGYRWYDEHHVKPLFPFGFGLSYTHFAVAHLSVSRSAAPTHFDVSARITNLGTRAGSDVIQLYAANPSADGEPPLRLAGFETVDVEPGATATVSMQVPLQAFKIWSTAAGGFVLSGGSYQLLLGDSSGHLPLGASIQLAPSTT